MPRALTGKERSDLVMRCLPIVRKAAWRLCARMPSSVDAEDLVSIGLVAVCEAADRFEDDRAESFLAYVKIRVRGAMLDELRRNDWVPRSVRDRSDRLKQARESLRNKLGRAPTEAELAAELGVDAERLRELLDDSAVLTLVSADANEETNQSVQDFLASDNDLPDDALMRAHTRELVRKTLDDLPARLRSVAELYYLRELSLREIGEIMGVTESRVCQLHTRLKERLKELIDVTQLAA